MLYIIRGSSCSGKDTLISKFFHPDNVLSSDEFRVRMFGDKHVQQFNTKVFSALKEALTTRLANRCAYTVINATNIKFKDIHDYIEIAKRFQTPYIIISLQPPSVEELERRNKKRYFETGFLMPDEVLSKHHQRYFTTMPKFIKQAEEDDLCKFIEVDQDYEIINTVD